MLAAAEVQVLLEARGVELAALPPTPLDSLLILGGSASSSSDSGGGGGGNYVPPAAGGSGGYMDFVFREAARQLFGREPPRGEPLPLKPGRNPGACTWRRLQCPVVAPQSGGLPCIT